jgi:predicted 3-demethylubiquinone-9 3-methyltransferase (glyoxalase superfamily)
MPKITPFLRYDTQDEEAMNFISQSSKNAKPGRVTRSQPQMSKIDLGGLKRAYAGK